jgi:hypothetical protein
MRDNMLTMCASDGVCDNKMVLGGSDAFRTPRRVSQKCGVAESGEPTSTKWTTNTHNTTIGRYLNNVESRF